VYSAQASFFLLMSLVPIVVLLVFVLRLTPLTEDMLLETFSKFIMEESMQQVRSILDEFYRGSTAVASFSAISLIWLSGRGILGLSSGLNSIYHLREDRNYLLLRLRSSLYAFVLIFAFIVSLFILVFSLRLNDRALVIFPFLKISDKAPILLVALLGLVILTLIFTLLYVLLPNRKKKYTSQIYGAMFTTASWCVFTFFFILYLRYSQNLSLIYGSLLTIVMAMFWLYICIYLFFFGAEINAYIENADSFPF